MKVIAHRGFWHSPEEKNSEIAFKRAVDFGFGIETDIRDFAGNLVVSHDLPSGNELGFEEFMLRYGCKTETLALNVKSDGLSDQFRNAIMNYRGPSMVFFDMSGPEQLQYIKKGLNTLNRISEFESGHEFEKADFGTWLDGFKEDEWRINWLCVNEDKPNVFVVSPELHGRAHLFFWEQLKQKVNTSNLFLCTDFPKDAREFFGLKND
jgi:hypothetical protein